MTLASASNPSSVPNREAVGVEPTTCDFVRLLKAFRPTGGTAPGDVMDEILKDHGRSDTAFAKLIASRQILAFRWRGSFWVPLFQFDPLDFSVTSGLRAVRSELPATFDDWAVASWLTEPHQVLGHRLPVDVMGVHVRAVRHAARETRVRVST